MYRDKEGVYHQQRHGEWDEAAHPREDNGRFGTAGGGSLGIGDRVRIDSPSHPDPNMQVRHGVVQGIKPYGAHSPGEASVTVKPDTGDAFSTHSKFVTVAERVAAGEAVSYQVKLDETPPQDSIAFSDLPLSARQQDGKAFIVDDIYATTKWVDKTVYGWNSSYKPDPALEPVIRSTVDQLKNDFPSVTIGQVTTGNGGGLYYPDTSEIFLGRNHANREELVQLESSRIKSGFSPDVSGHEGKVTLVHEYGHFLDDMSGGEGQRMAKAFPPVSDYAKTNPAERAAEAFLAGYLNPTKYPEAAKMVAEYRKRFKKK